MCFLEYAVYNFKNVVELGTFFLLEILQKEKNKKNKYIPTNKKTMLRLTLFLQVAHSPFGSPTVINLLPLSTKAFFEVQRLSFICPQGYRVALLCDGGLWNTVVGLF